MLFRYTSDKNGRPVKAAVIYTETEHCINKADIDPDALRVLKQLKSYGFEAYIVGGAVRDLLLKKEPKDFDLVTDATPARIKKMFRNSCIIGKRFRIVHIFFGRKIFEVTTFRSFAEGTTIGNAFGTIEEDVHRRDFTLNALYYDPAKNHIIDYVGGVKDIRAGKIVPVIPLRQIFCEDPVRMLRAVKYAASTGFKMSFFLKRKIASSAHLLAPVSPSRLTEELVKILNSNYAAEIAELALQSGLYMYLQPAASVLIAEKKDFAAAYFKSLQELNEFNKNKHDERLGAKIVYIIRDFIDNLTDWDAEIKLLDAPKSAHEGINVRISAAELYKFTWRECRSFVLPMNPQRTELEYAVRFCLKKLGIPVRSQKKPNKAKAKKDTLTVK